MARRRTAQVRGLLIGLVLLGVAGGGIALFFAEQDPYSQALTAGHRAFADGDYRRAAAAFDDALLQRPQAAPALFGQGLAQMQLGRNRLALELLSRGLAAATSDEERAYILANRGILHDRSGRYRQALEDYERARQLLPAVADGPGMMTRLVQNRRERPVTIADRARYLRAELGKPETERLLRRPELDARQSPYRN